MIDNGQQPLFYEDPYDALEKAIAASGKTKKELAGIVYPGRQIETAKSLLSRALSPENTDVNLSIETLLTLLKETRPDDFLFWLCDYFGFERPLRKDKETFEQGIKNGIKVMQVQLESLTKQLHQLEKINSTSK